MLLGSHRPLRATWLLLLLVLVAALALLPGPRNGAAAASLPGGSLPQPLLPVQADASLSSSSSSSSSSASGSLGRRLQQAGYTVTGSVKTARRSFSYKASRPGPGHGRRSQQ
ncbi:hypothetical protein HYH02_000666 [Chlamydomonas schloesseri]|uniref:Uncharacterized protein n=1 Tax=Chlamydomonas schloesseri TaxID=2026947 RepID=A0A835WWQ1_9CHLO|nr:hypothetical protein HYH02_000666 [Chlamydomonas schloesseri]|eukprot:KAG2454834.1 hypothetical protein HYH02_000666 [Chlamydomonas schloesseri]